MNHFQDDQAMDTDGNESHYNMNTQYNSRKNNNTRNNGNNNYSSNKSIHPLQQEYQQQPWLIPHPSLFISWKNNDHASHHSRENSYDRHFVVGAEAEPGGDRRSANYSISPPPQRITRHDNQPMPGGTKSLPSQLQGYRLQQHRPPVPVPLSSEQQQQQQQLQHYRDTASDQGHESDPSELLRAPILFNGSAHPTVVSGFGSRDEQDVYTIRRPNRSMSLSIGSSGANSYDDYNVWHAARRISPPALPPPSSMDHREVVPYSQEWRVILRSEARGRTVLYNPQMQSLVVQTTVGLDSHSMSLRDDSGICALCKRPLDLEEATGENDMSNPTSAFMDTNYFRMLADANIALSRRGSLQGDTSSQSRPDSSLGSPTSSGRASLDLDSTLASMHGSNSVCDTIMKESTQSSQSASSAAHLSHDALNQGYYERFFMEQRKLGRGFRGSVFLCQHVLDGIHLGEYAIKKVAVGDNHDWLVQMLREVHLLERLHHPNIVGYKHAWLENHQLHKFGPEVTCLFILMECANGGNLEEYIERPPEVSFSVDAEEHLGAADVVNTADESTLDSKKAMSAKERLQSKRQRLQNSLTSPGGKSGEGNNAFTQGSVSSYPRHYLSISEIWSFFFDICEGLAHLHRLGIIHRDLKPPNLLLSYSDSRVKGSKGERPRILITDFGECEISDQAAKRDRTGATGTLEFLAPELLAVDANGRYTDEFSFKGDMWSLGMVLYYLCYSRLPYSQIEDVDILRKEIRALKSISIPEDDGLGGRIIPEELKTLIRVLLSPEKSKRPSCDDILSMLNHQRDRMMHGEMDSPTAPIRSSTDANYKGPPTAADTEPSLLAMAEAEEIRDVEEDEAMKEMSAVSSSRSQLSRKRSNRGLQPAHHRHGYLIRHRQNPIISVSGKGRRSSKAGLAAEVPKPGRAMLTSAINRDNTASPSLNLNKKVKPLGLGLRHMLRRRMMHPIANGVGAFKSIRSNNDSSYNRYLQGYGAREGDMNMWSNTPSTVTFPIEVSKKVPSILAPTEYPGSQNDSSSNSIIKSLNRQSNTAPIDQPADHSRTRLNEGENSIQDMTRESANIPDGDKEVDMEVKQVINALPETGVSRKISDDGIIEPETTPAIVEDGKPGPKLIRQKPRQDEQGRLAEPYIESQSSYGQELLTDTTSSDDEDARVMMDRKKIALRGNLNDGKKSYWSKLASAHAHERSRSISKTTTDVSISSSAGYHPSEPAMPRERTRLGKKRVEAKAKPEAELANVESKVGMKPLRRPRSNTNSGHSLHEHHRSQRYREGQQLSELQQLQRPQQYLHSPHHRHLPHLQEQQYRKHHTLPERFSVHFMFLSLVVRVWFCLSICNPIMVRSLVLYPVLILTVIWDRYLLSLISKKFFKRKSSALTLEPLQSLPLIPSLPAIPAEAVRRRRGSMVSRTRRMSVYDDKEAGVSRQRRQVSSGETDDEISSSSYGDEDNERGIVDQGSSGAMIVDSKHGGRVSQGQDRDQDQYGRQNHKQKQGRVDAVPIWQAFASGVFLQLFWIGCVWIFSHDGLCNQI